MFNLLASIFGTESNANAFEKSLDDCDEIHVSLTEDAINEIQQAIFNGDSPRLIFSFEG